MENEKENQTIRLKNGRLLGFAEYGHLEGPPVLYFTGGNSSRFEGRWFAQAALRSGVRLIVPDRPGFGLSTHHLKRELLDWPSDVLQLVKALSIETFSVFGLSGGGPHVLAVAHEIPERLNRVAIVSGTASPDMPDQYQGMWPPVKLIFMTAKKLPGVNRFILKQMAGFYSNEEQMLKRMKQALPKPDAELIDINPDIIRVFAQATKEAHRNGVEGDAREWHLYVNDWGFQLKEISKEIKLWYGIYDQQVPVEMGRYLSKHLANSQLVEVEDGGHFSTINNHIDDILSYLTD
jgi:pimeloyl-ACP methyl ester carboxylesterase